MIEVGGSLGGSANMSYFFERDVDRKELTAVVVAVDGEPKIFKSLWQN
jgi:hypothetical protein